MITFDEMLAKHPPDPEIVRRFEAEIQARQAAYRLREVRQALGVTQVELAKAINVGQNRISNIETGNLESIGIGTLRRYVEGLGLEMSVTVRVGEHQCTLAAS